MKNNRPDSINVQPNRVTAVILAGGAGQRFDGADKGLELYRGRPLVEHVINALTPQVNEMLISVNRNLNVYKEYGFELVTDEDSSYQGPMAGISAAIKHLKKSDTDALLVSTCDSPSLPEGYVDALTESLTSSSAQVGVVHDGQRRQNLHCLIQRDAWGSLTRFYDEGNRAMHRWYKNTPLIEVDFSAQAACFSNLNSPSALEKV